MGAIAAGRARPGAAVVAFDGARLLGAKILVAGGGRCNVTHDVVTEAAYAGSPRNAVRRVLGRFTVGRTVEFFHGLGVDLKREATGKLFPTTDRARDVLDALTAAARDAGVRLRHPWRVQSVRRSGRGFEVVSAPERGGTPEMVAARRVILATGGKSLPRSGSDGHGYEIARSLGHTVTRTFPGLVPLTLPRDHFLCALSGLAAPATLELRGPTGRRGVSFTDSTLCTHFGLSGPGVLDISRYWLDAPTGSTLAMNWLPGVSAEQLDAELAALGGESPARFLARRLPERLVRALCGHAAVEAGAPAHTLTRERRRGLARAMTDLVLPITGDRGYTYAEVTAGGVPLAELHLESMESRICPGLHVCGELCDVDGRIGGYNFQWAWASGHVAGVAAAEGTGC
ncbi:MAG: aminoacetone oxidase family FAD-binding enzyme [Phycisphaerales bacterium]|nr:aminoacetone oxidase family FAD-binding enzyme [Phycisphaerales bacterium]